MLRIVLLALGAACVAAQTPKFDVAAVRPCRAGDATPGAKQGRGGGGGRARTTSDMLVIECRPLVDLIRMAYVSYASGKPWTIDAASGVPMPPVSQRLMQEPIPGGPGWVDSDRYTIDAKAAGPQAMEMMRGPMLQALLEERFHLKVRRETREVPVYALTVAKGTPKLQPTRPGSCQAIDITHPEEIRRPCGGFRPSILEKSPKVDRETASHSVGVDTIGQTIGGLCRQLSVALDRDVVDRTGIPACSISTWN